jgi:hypothetical protein
MFFILSRAELSALAAAQTDATAQVTTLGVDVITLTATHTDAEAALATLQADPTAQQQQVRKLPLCTFHTIYPFFFFAHLIWYLLILFFFFCFWDDY